ncbi:MAG: hypothetical protein ABI811_19545 [Acidobacteriota bacterium]
MTPLKQFRSTLLTASLAALAFAVPAVVQAAGNLADGWSMRADSGAGADNKLAVEGGAFHFIMSGAPNNNGTFSNPAWTATGNHTFSATMTQNVKATHPTAYGLMLGGSNLAADNQTYTYFMVRQAGEFYIANRVGAAVTAVAPWTANKAIKPEGADGKQTNTLSVQVAGTNVIFSVNGTEVTRFPAAGLHVNGLYGFRVGHRLDVTATDVMK